jgi:hypothetical protein
MTATSYVVHLLECDDAVPFKHYSVRADAVAYGRSRVQSGDAEQADIYAVADTSDARAAIAAFKVGKASYVQSCSRHASEADIESANRRAWEAARKAGPRAVLKYLGLAKDASPNPPKIRRRKFTE